LDLAIPPKFARGYSVQVIKDLKLPTWRGISVYGIAGLDPARRLAILTIAARITFFATPLGLCGVAWTGRGIAGLQLPESTATATRRRLRLRFPDATVSEKPPAIQDVVDTIVTLLEGRRADLSGVALDMDGIAEFDRRVYDVTRAIACGTTLSYGAVAARLGDPGASRAVGQALGRNPFPLIVPCHRVLSADGSLGGFSAAGTHRDPRVWPRLRHN
jgi:methylated-DNA-[protein]-cysteine S-methyltransferase